MKPAKTKTGEARTILPKSALRENIEAILVAIILALFIRTFIVQAFKIPSGSMLETLQIGDHILVNKFIYGIKLPFLKNTGIPVKEPEREDIVVFRYPKDPSKDFIKRVIGLEGDVVEIREKKLFVNNIKMERGYAVFRDSNDRLVPRDNMPPFTVPQDKLFVMGDNRDNSHDSRFWGFVDRRDIRGKAFLIYWSWDKEKWKWLRFWEGIRWGRLGNVLK